MTIHSLPHSALIQSTWCALAHVLAHPQDRLSALILEWRNRREIAHGLGRLSGAHLRDIGLTEADIEAACTDSFVQPASKALTRAVQTRMGNW